MIPIMSLEEAIELIKKSKEDKEIIETFTKEAEEFKSTDTAVLLYQRKYDESQEKVKTEEEKNKALESQLVTLESQNKQLKFKEAEDLKEITDSKAMIDDQ